MQRRVNAHHLLGEMAVAIMKLHQETPAMLAARFELPPSNSPLPYLLQYNKTMEEQEEEMSNKKSSNVNRRTREMAAIIYGSNRNQKH
jgi:hypothetical protein